MSVYITKIANSNIVKIGCSQNPKGRMLSLKKAYGEMQILRIVDGDFKAERWFHTKFSDNRIKNELFLFHEDMLSIEPPDSFEEKKSFSQQVHKITFDAPLDLWAALQAISEREMIPVAAIIRANLLKSLAAEVTRAAKEHPNPSREDDGSISWRANQ